MKKFLAIASLFFILGCNKGDVDGIIIITVSHDGKIVPNPTIYMKKGSAKNPKIPLSRYDLSVVGNSLGQVVFENLASDSYYFYTTAKIDTILVTGEAFGTVTPKVAPNRYELKIYAL